MAALELIKDGLTVDSVSLSGPKTEWTIGRSLECDLNVGHESVSRRHARVHVDDGAYYITRHSQCACLMGSALQSADRGAS